MLVAARREELQVGHGLARALEHQLLPVVQRFFAIVFVIIMGFDIVSSVVYDIVVNETAHALLFFYCRVCFLPKDTKVITIVAWF